MAYQEDEEGLLNDILEGKDGQRVQVMAEGEGLTRQGTTKLCIYNRGQGGIFFLPPSY